MGGVQHALPVVIQVPPLLSLLLGLLVPLLLGDEEANLERAKGIEPSTYSLGIRIGY